VGDCLVIEGRIQGSNQLTNAFNASWDVPWINIEKYAQVDCLEASYPTIAENNISQTKNNGGAKVTLEKIQITNDHTRILLTIENTSQDSELTFYSFNSVLVQGTSQFETEYIFAEYDDVKSSIPYGIIEKGWVIFEPVKPKAFEIRLSINERTSDYKTSGNRDFIFQINSVNELNFSIPTKTSTTENKQRQSTSESTKSDSSKNVNFEHEIQELKKKIKELESANEKLQNTIDMLQSQTTENDISKSTTKKEIASFVDSSKDPQSYIDRYNNESTYKEWFEENYPEYESIYQAVGKREPVPSWIQNNAKWWSEGKLSEDDFINGIEYLVKNGIIKVN